MNVYLDHAATTPLHPTVKDVMLPFLDAHFGNPSSLHQQGREVRKAIDSARRQVATALGVKSNEILFTSGGTESDNLAVLGLMEASAAVGKRHVITSAIEHHAVLDTCQYLERKGFDVTYLPVDQTGRINLTQLQAAIRSETALVSIMWVNNEVGALQPIEEIHTIAQENNIPLHVDAVQALGMIDLAQVPVDVLTVSGHKINGPKGVGALYLRKGLNWLPRQFGGTQELRKRPGTENVLGIVGFGKAIELATKQRVSHLVQMGQLRDYFLAQLKRERVPFSINGDVETSLPHIINLSFVGVATEVMLMNLDLAGIACASGSACTSGTLATSHVLAAMQLPEQRTRSAIRFSFGRETSNEQLLYTTKQIAIIFNRLTGNHTRPTNFC